MDIKKMEKTKSIVEDLSGEEVRWEGTKNNKMYFKAKSKYISKNEYCFDLETKELFVRKILNDQVGEVGEFKKLLASKKVELVTGTVRPRLLAHKYEDGSIKVKNSGRWLPVEQYNKENQQAFKRAFE